MSAYNPPVENVPIFDAGLFRTTNGEGEFLTIAEANKLYLQFPFGQGTETIPAVNITGNATISNNIVMNGTAGTNFLQFPDGSQQFVAVPNPIPADTYDAVLNAGDTATEKSAKITGTGVIGTATATNSKASIVIQDSDFAGTIAQSSLTNKTLNMIAGIPIGYSQSLNLILDTGGASNGLYHSDTNPSSPSPFVISTDQDLQLTSGLLKNFLVSSANITASPTSIMFGNLSTQFTTHTATGFNANDNSSSAFAYYRNNQMSIYGTGNASLFANKTTLTYTDSAGTATGALSSNSLTMIDPTTGTSVYSGGSARISSANSAGASAPILQLQNSTAGASAGVAIETFKNGGAGVIGDEVFRLSMKGKNSGNTTAEYGRITCNIRDPTTSGAGIDGGLILSAPINNTMTSFLDLNGNNGNVNCLRNLDMRANDILSTTANLRLITSASSGAGSITIEPKGAGTGFLILNNLPTSSVGLPVGAVWKNGSVLNIV